MNPLFNDNISGGNREHFPTDFFDLWRDLCSYLKGLKEAPSPATPVFHFVILASDTHHGLAVQVELLIKGLQQGGARSLLLHPKREKCQKYDAKGGKF